jgi:acyl carrier protein
MKGSQDPALKLRLKQLIVTEADKKDVAPESITDDEVLFGPEAPLALDSIDGLTLSMALQYQFGVRITDPKELLRVMRSINTLADHLQPA